MKAKQSICACVLVRIATYPSFLSNELIMLIMNCAMVNPLISSQLTYSNFNSTIRSCSELDSFVNSSTDIIKPGFLFDVENSSSSYNLLQIDVVK